MRSGYATKLGGLASDASEGLSTFLNEAAGRGPSHAWGASGAEGSGRDHASGALSVRGPAQRADMALAATAEFFRETVRSPVIDAGVIARRENWPSFVVQWDLVYDSVVLEDILDLLWSSEDLTPLLLTHFSREWLVIRAMMRQRSLEPWPEQNKEQSLRRVPSAARFSSYMAWATLITVINAAFAYYRRLLPIDSSSSVRSFEPFGAISATSAQPWTTGMAPALLASEPPVSTSAHSVADSPKGAAPPATASCPIALLKSWDAPSAYQQAQAERAVEA